MTDLTYKCILKLTRSAVIGLQRVVFLYFAFDLSFNVASNTRPISTYTRMDMYIDRFGLSISFSFEFII